MCTGENSTRLCYTHFDWLHGCANGSAGCYKHVTWSSANGSSAVTSGVHPHWLSFGKESYYTHVCIGTFLLVVLMLSVTGNTIIILVFSRYRRLQNASNMLIINLAVSDLSMAVTGIPLHIIASFKAGWPFSHEVCEFYGFSGGMFGLLSINTLAVVSIDRYIVIVRSTATSNRLSRKTAMLLIVAVWLYAFSWSAPPLFGWNKYTWEGFGTSCSFDYLTHTTTSRAFILSMFIGGFVVPLLVIVYCYTYILYCVIVRRRQLQATFTTKSPAVRKAMFPRYWQTETRTARSIFIIIALFCLSWGPYATVSLIGIYGNQRVISPLFASLAGLMGKMSTIYNPFVYSLCHPKFKVQVKRLFTVASFKQTSSLKSNRSPDTYQCANYALQHRQRRKVVQAPSGFKRSDYISMKLQTVGGGAGARGGRSDAEGVYRAGEVSRVGGIRRTRGGRTVGGAHRVVGSNAVGGQGTVERVNIDGSTFERASTIGKGSVYGETSSEGRANTVKTGGSESPVGGQSIGCAKTNGDDSGITVVESSYVERTHTDGTVNTVEVQCTVGRANTVGSSRNSDGTNDIVIDTGQNRGNRDSYRKRSIQRVSFKKQEE